MQEQHRRRKADGIGGEGITSMTAVRAVFHQQNLQALLLAGREPSPGIRTRLDLFAISPTTAVVRVIMEGDAVGADYTDFQTLIKPGAT